MTKNSYNFTHELVILTKFHKDSQIILDFLVLAKFLASLIFLHHSPAVHTHINAVQSPESVASVDAPASIKSRQTLA